MKRWISALAGALLLASCKSGSGTSADAVEPNYTKAHDIQQLMAVVVQPQADIFWKSTGMVIDAEGQHDLRPTTDEAWLRSQSAAATVTEMGNLLQTPLYAAGRGKDWMQFAKALSEIGQKAEQAAKDRASEEAIIKIGETMYNICSACHQAYPPAVGEMPAGGSSATKPLPAAALAHDVAEGDKAFVQSIDGPAFIPFLYLGAKHMVTGYDHILFLIGVVFFLYRLKDVVLYVSMFTIGHSITLLGGVLLGFGVNSYLIDTIIALSVVYKGFENIGGFKRLGFTPNTKLVVLVFGLFHGLGLSSKLMSLDMSQNGLLVNLIGFNVGVEVGQVIVLACVVTVLNLWRTTRGFARGAYGANVALIVAGLLLAAWQIKGYLTA